jgi:4-hydroxy-2-oxoheptanedioate aldolase
MADLRKRLTAGERLFGTWCSLGSSVTTEMAGNAGFDWVLIDLEHGSGGESELLHQLQSLTGSPTAPIVRIEWNEPPRFKRVLDMGASGVMVPWVSTREEAERAAAAARYSPEGIRGMASRVRATRYGAGFSEYVADANDRIVTVVQIETAEAVQNIDAIASVEGVDVLFIGPLDLSTNLGIQKQFDHDRFRSAVRAVTGAAARYRKASGILLWEIGAAQQALADGFSFVAVGSDVGAVWLSMSEHMSTLRSLAGDT